ncbi:MAG: hypothetical protein DWQ05_14240 [Calditrichaeota bacterium]|nr:MAG: hypothetical protein DWQ05_14240 [Calditrichota bacterium]
MKVEVENQYTNLFFEEYKDIHYGQSAIIFGSGPSLNEWEDNEYPDVIRAGVNELVFTPILLDYYFSGDSQEVHRPGTFAKNKQAYYDYLPRIQKFIRKQTWGERGALPRDISNAVYYWCDLTSTPVKDISTQPVGCCASISFEALQFLLYAGIKRVYLVGQDCSYNKGTFRSATANDPFHITCGNDMLVDWQMIHDQWLPENYPDVEIFSIRPVALKTFPEVSQNEIR